MKRIFVVLALGLLPCASLAAPGDGGPVVGEGGVLGAGPGGFDPCYRGTIFNALKVVRAYRDNRAFAYHHFEGKQLEISGRLLLVARDVVRGKKLENGVEIEYPQDVFVAVVTPDGKPPQRFALEFRFPVDQIKDNPQARCDLAELFAGQFVTIRGTCVGPKATEEGDYVAIIFENSELAR